MARSSSISPGTSPELARGRDAYARRAWPDVYGSLSSADRVAPLGPDDLALLATSAYLVGRDEESLALLERAHLAYLEIGDPVGAARSAFWIGFHLANRGDVARATGWLGRAGRLLDRHGGDCVERGYLLLPVAYQQLAAGNAADAEAGATEAARIAERFDDAELLALALHLRGRAALMQGRTDEGMALLDESMVAVAADALSPPVTGLIYCGTIGVCRRIYALRRAHEWTAALTEWCGRQPDMVVYSGECLVYRAEILQLHGAWQEALAEAQRAWERLSPRPEPRLAAAALYRQGEIHRLIGEFAAAEEAYRNASRSGWEPQPGLALLRLARNDVGAAAAAMRRALGETRDPWLRAGLLPAHVEITLAEGAIEDARGACGELEQIAAGSGASVLWTMVGHARGAIDLAAGDAMAALAGLRDACRGWQALDAPYEVARTRVLLGLACRALGDEDTAALELDAARGTFERLGAVPDLARLPDPTGPARPRGTHGLTRREQEVLRLLATGRTNRAIANRLGISERTVARHASNIFGKLGLSSRSAATAWAYEHLLVPPPT